MSKKRFNAEQIVVVLRQIEVLMLQGNATAIACFCGLAEPLRLAPEDMRSRYASMQLAAVRSFCRRLFEQMVTVASSGALAN